MKYSEVQKIAKNTIEYIKNEIHAGMKLIEVRRLCEDIYTENGNTALLSSVDYFTFEPHISVKGSKYGYKKENIYYFVDGKLKEL